MANAWIIRPEVIFGARASATSVGDPLYVANDYMGVIWGANGGQIGGGGTFYHYLTVDLGSAIMVDTVMLTGLPAGVPAGAECYLQAMDGIEGNPVWGGPTYPLLAGSEPLIGGKAISLWGATDVAPPASRWWRVVVFAPAPFDLRVSRLVLGARLRLSRNFVFGAAFGVRDFGKLDFSDRAVLLRRRGPKLRTVGVSFDNVHKDEVEGAIAPLIERIGATDCVGLVTDPDPHPMRQRRCYFGPIVGDLGWVQRTAAGWRVAVNIVSLV